MTEVPVQSQSDVIEESLEQEANGQMEGHSSSASTHARYMQAAQEARMWKSRYMTSASDKAKQLREIESSLMVLEARLKAERDEIERRFEKQAKAMKEQKRKIAKLATANRKLLSGLMALSQQSPTTDETKLETSEDHEESEPISNQSSDNRPIRKDLENNQNENLLDQERSRAHRSKSLPLNRYLRHNKNATTC
ncbi:unnamed protein product [Clavelina lepadiformis]|uniref:Uncharacterized protein n=1 Tax=Clavelina lepadiformis TaxID=159417 RepID=A0ABP0F274_CLALP